MSLSKGIGGQLAQVLLSERLLNYRRKGRDLKRVAQRRSHLIEFFFNCQDPYSYLMAQVLPKLLPEGVELICHLLPPDNADALGDVTRHQEYAIRDASLLASHHKLHFPANPQIPSQDICDNINNTLAGLINQPKQFLHEAVQLGALAFQAPQKASISQNTTVPPTTAALLEHGRKRQQKMGHYLSGTLYYEGEWYWGIDRLTFFLQRLETLGLKPFEPYQHWLHPKQNPVLAKTRDTPLEWYFSFRSPYSYLSVDRVLKLAEASGVELILKPVMPMVTRGISLSRAKKTYILLDTARLARSLNLPYGNIRDPLGRGIDNCFAMFLAAQKVGKERDFTRSALQGIWSRGWDTATKKGLRAISEDAGLSWAEMEQALETPQDQLAELANSNRKELYNLGMWGVPAFRYGSFSIWGQDRLQILAHRMS